MAAYQKTKEAIAKLSPEEFRVTQQSGTERPGTGALLASTKPRRLANRMRVELPTFACSMLPAFISS